MKYIFEIGEKFLEKDSNYQNLKKNKVELLKYSNKDFMNLTDIDKQQFNKNYVNYIKILFNGYKRKVNAKEISNKNKFQSEFNNYLKYQKEKIIESQIIFENRSIFINFKQKFNKPVWPIKLDQKLEKLNNFKNTYSILISNTNSKDIWKDFIYPSNIYLKRIKLFKKDIAIWIKNSPEEFKNYFNKEKYKLNINRNLNKIKDKQNDLNFFNNLGN